MANKYTLRRIARKRDKAYESLQYNEKYAGVVERLLDEKIRRKLEHMELQAKKKLYPLEVAATDPADRMEARQVEMELLLEKVNLKRRMVEQSYARLERKAAGLEKQVETNKAMASQLKNDAELARTDAKQLRASAVRLREAVTKLNHAAKGESDAGKILKYNRQASDFAERAKDAERQAKRYEKQGDQYRKKAQKLAQQEQPLLQKKQALEKQAAVKKEAAKAPFAEIDRKVEGYERKLDVLFPRNVTGKAAPEAVAQYRQAQKASDEKIAAFKQDAEQRKQQTLKKVREKIAAENKKNQAVFEKSHKVLSNVHGTVEMDQDCILSIRHLTMHFTGVKAVDDVSFDIKRGEIFGLIGPNGAGKTTLFNCITQFYKPTGGELYYRDGFGHIINLMDYVSHDIIKTGIVRTFQNLELVGAMSVLDNLLIAAHTSMKANIAQQFLHSKAMRNEEQVYRIQAQEILRRLNLEQYQNALPMGLPYGILKKIELARTLMAKPKLIILDEPAAGLNDVETEEFRSIIRQIRDDYNCTIFLVEHDMGLVMSVCDTVCAISFGKKLAIGTPEEIQKNPLVQEAYLGVKEEAK